ncbi:Phosphoribosylformylglycinamidine cyclo-ligase [Symmachiella dynata]|uniref:phosphoribosylformylglycinamidine cyclo-ligase n=1 Tax=Symmachiella dynata TaxID=2527995 RepID=UPI00118864C7|nr:phosphoribosylformylglycinamidine cyclo-ligase [Symmachiella dynata]QDT46238.1 Phosphoribosylformylglycinamidine cyclo-ligase [Symmachiella dynata]
MAAATYKDAGVDLELYQQAMARLPKMMQRTRTPRVLDLPGGFAGLFGLNRPGQPYEDPVLVSGTDGVGTKIKVAIQAKKFDTIGVDLVAMCVNDCLCLGAEPLFFLDYLALGKDDPELIAELVSGVSDACVETGSALLGGETAIMPDLYAAGDFDMAGFSVGVVERNRTIDGQRIQPGDVILGLDSSGFHSNGYSLIRKVVFEGASLSIDDTIPELGATVAEVLLKPTRLYVSAIQAVLKQSLVVHGMAHNTGGGLQENVARILPEGCRAEIDRGSWQPLPEFAWLQQLGNIDRDEMFRVFNMGIGYVVIAPPENVAVIQQALTGQDVGNQVIGKIVAGEPGVDYTN